MRILGLFFLFLLHSWNAFALFECPLSERTKERLIKESPYFVDDIKCVRHRGSQVYEWYISNKRVFAPDLQTLAKYKSLEKYRKPKVVKNKAVKKGVAIPKRIVKAASKKTKEVQPIRQKKPSRGLSFIPGLNEWKTSVIYGGKYLSLEQSGSLLNAADVDVTFFNQFALKTDFIFENWEAWINLSTYKFKYATLDQDDESSFNSFEVGGAYKWLVASIESEENPLFKNNSGDVLMSKMNIISLGVGAQKSFELPSLSPTFLKLRGLVQYPFQSGTNDTQIKIDSFSGFGVRADAALTREIFAKVNYSLLLTWTVDASYKKFSTELEWGGDRGDADSSIMSFSSGLGLVFLLK